MRLYKLDGGRLQLLKDQGFALEQKLQNIVEGNLETFFRLKFVKSEFVVHGSRIDTLAFDEETSSFVIIEYKREKTSGVADQGAFYLVLTLENKADFVLEYLNKFPDSKLKKQDVDWSQSRVILISDSFNVHQVGAIGLRELHTELWEAKLFENGIIGIEQVRPLWGSSGEASLLKGSKELEIVAKEVKTYDLNWHFGEWSASRELYDSLQAGILDLGPNVTVRFTKFYISFVDETVGKSIAEVVPQKKGLKVYLRPTIDNFQSPVLKLTDCRERGHWTNGNSFFDLSRREDAPHALSLIKQAWDILRSGKG